MGAVYEWVLHEFQMMPCHEIKLALHQGFGNLVHKPCLDADLPDIAHASHWTMSAMIMRAKH